MVLVLLKVLGLLVGLVVVVGVVVQLEHNIRVDKLVHRMLDILENMRLVISCPFV